MLELGGMLEELGSGLLFLQVGKLRLRKAILGE